nr:helix-turn-helix transcriptional regulator [Herbihabitans rhizosphaerae]
MRDALVAREVSAVYRLLRRHGVSQRQIAAMTGQSQSEVSEILKGRQVMAYDVLVRIAGGLGVPRGYMGLAYDDVTAVRVAGSKEVTEPEEEDESMKRRQFLAHAAAVTVGANVLGIAEPGSWVAHAAQTPAPHRIGMTDVRQIEAATKALRALDYRYGGGACRDAVVAQLSWGRQMLGSTASDQVKQKLHIALADLHSLAGWTSHDIGLHDAARTHFGKALELAKEGGNEQLVANVLYRMGRVYIHTKAPDEALKMLQLGQIAAQESGSELAVAVICANQAWAYAMMGHKDMAMQLVGRTRDEWQRAQGKEVEDWVRFFGETDVYGMIGTVHTVLAQGEHPEHTKFAIPALTRCIDLYGEEMTRSKTFGLSLLATNHLLDGDVDHGAKLGRTAIDLASDLKSVRAKDRMEPLQIEAAKRRNSSDARDLAEIIAKFRGPNTLTG